MQTMPGDMTDGPDHRPEDVMNIMELGATMESAMNSVFPDGYDEGDMWAMKDSIAELQAERDLQDREELEAIAAKEAKSKKAPTQNEDEAEPAEQTED